MSEYLPDFKNTTFGDLDNDFLSDTIKRHIKGIKSEQLNCNHKYQKINNICSECGVRLKKTK